MCFISIGEKIQKYECECYAIKNVCHVYLSQKADLRLFMISFIIKIETQYQMCKVLKLHKKSTCSLRYKKKILGIYFLHCVMNYFIALNENHLSVILKLFSRK